MGRIRRSKIWKEKKNTQNIIPPEINTSLVHDSVHVITLYSLLFRTGLALLKLCCLTMGNTQRDINFYIIQERI